MIEQEYLAKCPIYYFSCLFAMKIIDPSNFRNYTNLNTCFLSGPQHWDQARVNQYHGRVETYQQETSTDCICFLQDKNSSTPDV